MCEQRQAAAVRMLLGFFALGVFAFEVSRRYVQRLVPEAIRVHPRVVCANLPFADQTIEIEGKRPLWSRVG